MVKIIEAGLTITFLVLGAVKATTGFILSTKPHEVSIPLQGIRPMLKELEGSVDQFESYLKPQNFTAEQIGTCLQNSTLEEIQHSLNSTSPQNKTRLIITALAKSLNITHDLMNSLYYPCDIKRYLTQKISFTSKLDYVLQYSLNATNTTEPEVTIGLICREPSGCMVAQLLAIMREFRKIFQLAHDLI